MSDDKVQSLGNCSWNVIHNKSPVQLLLCDDELSLRKNTNSGKKKKDTEQVVFRTIPLREIIAVTEKANQKKKCFKIIFITKKKKYIWRRTSATFCFPNEYQLCDDVVSTLRDKLNSVPDRPKNLLIFVNPVSGWHKGVKIYRQVVSPMLEEANIKAEYIVTTHSGHIKEYILNLDNDLSIYDGVIGVGGDGTLTEAMNALLIRQSVLNGCDVQNDPSSNVQRLTIRLGIVPAGSGECFVRLSTNTWDAETALLHVISGYSHVMNVMSVYNDQQLLSFGSLMVNFGYMADVFKLSEANKKFGRLRYLYYMYKAFKNHRNIKVQISYREHKFSVKEGRNEAARTDWIESEEEDYKGIDVLGIDPETTGVADYVQLATVNSTNSKKEHFSKLQYFRPLSEQLDKQKTKLSNHRYEQPDYIKRVNEVKVVYKSEIDQASKHQETICIDGESLPLVSPQVLIRLNHDVVEIFGCGNVDRRNVFNSYLTLKENNRV